MKKKLSLIIPLLAIFCLISGGYALISNNMIADDNSNYESPATITDSISNTTTITKIENTDIAEKNTEDNTIETTKQKSSTQITTNNTKETELNYTDEWIINSPEGTGTTPPGYEEEEYTVSDCMLAKIEHNLDYIKGNIDAGHTKITSEIYHAFVKLNVPNIDHYYKLLTDQIANEKVPTNVQPEISTPDTSNNNQEINHDDVNNQVPNDNAQPEIPTPNNNQETGYRVIEYHVG